MHGLIRGSRAKVLFASLMLFVIGCGSNDSIESYTVPREATNRAHVPVSTNDLKYRLLGAMFPAEKPIWYFKFAGTTEQVARHEREFDALIRSVKLRPDAAMLPEFTVPNGWTATGPRVSRRMGVAIRIDETLRFGGPDEPLEVTISGGSSGGTIQNFVRWSGQVGNTDPSEQDYARGTNVFEALGGKGLKVDVYGPKNPAGGPMMGRK